MRRSRLGNIIFSVFILSVSLILIPVVSSAVCPVCTVAVAGGVGLSRWLGIDDTISGLWIGGLTLSLAFLALSWLKRKKIKFPLEGFFVFAVSYLITFSSLYFAKFIGYSCQRLWGLDKLVLGIIFGSIGFGFGVCSDYFLRSKNKGRVYFPFQKVILPVSSLIILSVVFYLITKG